MPLPTKWYRATCKAVAREIIAPEPYCRAVRITVPDNEVTEIGLTQSPEELAGWLQDVDKLAQDAQLPLVPSDVTFKIVIQPGQGAIGRCREGLSEVSIIVEYLE